MIKNIKKTRTFFTKMMSYQFGFLGILIQFFMLLIRILVIFQNFETRKKTVYQLP
jgi:hypothetical protein